MIRFCLNLKGSLLVAILSLFLMSQGVLAAEIEINLNHLLIEPAQDGKLHVTEQYLIINPQETEMTETEINFLLPQGAENIHFDTEEMEGNSVVTEDEIVYTQNLVPGDNVLVYHYLLDNHGEDHFHWDRGFNQDITAFFVMVPAGILQLAGNQLVDQGVTTMGTKQFHIYGGNFNAGDFLSFTVHPGAALFQPEGIVVDPGFGERNIAPPLHSKAHIDWWNSSPLRGIEPHLFMLFIIGLPLGLLGGYLFKKGRANEQKSVQVTEKQDTREIEIKEEILKEKIVQLEQDYDQGIVKQDEYNRKMEFYKNKIIELRLKKEGR